MPASPTTGTSRKNNQSYRNTGSASTVRTIPGRSLRGMKRAAPKATPYRIQHPNDHPPPCSKNLLEGKVNQPRTQKPDDERNRPQLHRLTLRSQPGQLNQTINQLRQQAHHCRRDALSLFKTNTKVKDQKTATHSISTGHYFHPHPDAAKAQSPASRAAKSAEIFR